MRKMIRHFCDFIFGKHKNNTLPRVWILAVDMAIVIFAYVIADLMLYYEYLPVIEFNWKMSWLLPLFYLITFLVTKTYDGMLRYAGFMTFEKYSPLVPSRLDYSLPPKYSSLKSIMILPQIITPGLS